MYGGALGRSVFVQVRDVSSLEHYVRPNDLQEGAKGGASDLHSQTNNIPDASRSSFFPLSTTTYHI